jgi:hypothetical protein
MIEFHDAMGWATSDSVRAKINATSLEDNKEANI